MTDDIPPLTLRFIDEADEKSGEVPAQLLAEALIHGQRAVHLLAMTAAGREFKERLRVPADIANEFTLVCEIPQKGSYAQPLASVRPETRKLM